MARIVRFHQYGDPRFLKIVENSRTGTPVSGEERATVSRYRCVAATRLRRNVAGSQGTPTPDELIGVNCAACTRSRRRSVALRRKAEHKEKRCI